MVILGIDPGTNIMGYGVIESEGSKIKCLAVGVLDIHKVEDKYLRLQIYKVFNRI